MAHWYIRPQSDDEQGINKLRPNATWLIILSWQKLGLIKSVATLQNKVNEMINISLDHLSDKPCLISDITLLAFLMASYRGSHTEVFSEKGVF